ncbi:MAG: class I SAM-dependent methyltransferase [Promethearchaeota archaeon]
MVKKVYEGTIESTMVGPLYARAKYSALYPEITRDPLAEDIYKKVKEMYSDQQEEFLILEKFMDEFTSLNFLFRARKFDDEIRNFKIIHPSATIINLGCGLDTTNFRIGDDNLKWFQIDLPDGIEFREKLIPSQQNSKNIAKSIFDYSWFDDVEFNEKKGVLLLAAGLFNYFQEAQLKELCDNLARNFIGGTLIFDLPSNMLKNIINRKYKKLGFQGADHEFGLGKPKKILNWSNNIKTISCTIFFKGIGLNHKWNKKTQFLMKLFRTFRFYKFLKVEFK